MKLVYGGYFPTHTLTSSRFGSGPRQRVRAPHTRECTHNNQLGLSGSDGWTLLCFYFYPSAQLVPAFLSSQETYIVYYEYTLYKARTAGAFPDLSGGIFMVGYIPDTFE